jgi:hypothetical protein
MKYPCYTTRTGIRIGSAYQPPMRSLTRDEEMVQSAFIVKKTKTLSLKATAFICLGLAVAVAWITKP